MRVLAFTVPVMAERAAETKHAATVGADDAGARLDKFLAGARPELSRSRVKALIVAGLVSAGEATIADPSYRVKSGQRFTLRVPAAVAAAPRPQAIRLDVVYEDRHLIVVDKPAGMVVHPAPGNPDRTLVNALIAHCGASLSGIGGVRRPGIVHRLDKDTSGLMVAAKDDAAHTGLVRQFAAREVERAYRALVWGLPLPRRGEIRSNIGRSPRNRKKMAVLSRGGRPALTRYRVLTAFADTASLVDCRLATGRTHQIRVHLAHLGHPVIGDKLYGRARAGRLAGLPEAARGVLSSFARQALHAYVLGFSHPLSHEPLSFDCPLPIDMKQLMSTLETL